MRVRLEVVQGRNAPRTLEIDAASREDAKEQAKRQGYTVLASRPVGMGWRDILQARSGSAQTFDVVVFAEQLRDLLGAGLNVIEAMTTLHRSAPSNARFVLGTLLNHLRGGQRFSQALALQPRIPSLLVALVRASELTSALPDALARFIDHEKRTAELRHRFLSVAIYPLLVIGVGFAVLLFLLFYVMPRFARIFGGMGGELPWSARLMVWWAHQLAANGAWFVGALAVTAIAGLVVAFSSRIRGKALQRVLEWSLLRSRLRTYFLARWYRATGMLVEGGIPLIEALQLAGDTLPIAMRAGGMATERAVRDGHGPAAAYAIAAMATPVAEQLLMAGERTGALGTVLSRVAEFHEAELARSLERGMRALEPIVTVGVGVGVGVIVVLMYLPIFELAAAIQ
jgi:general secretion pathway protein F